MLPTHPARPRDVAVAGAALPAARRAGLGPVHALPVAAGPGGVPRPQAVGDLDGPGPARSGRAGRARPAAGRPRRADRASARTSGSRSPSGLDRPRGAATRASGSTRPIRGRWSRTSTRHSRQGPDRRRARVQRVRGAVALPGSQHGRDADGWEAPRTHVGPYLQGDDADPDGRDAGQRRRPAPLRGRDAPRPRPKRSRRSCSRWRARTSATRSTTAPT